ncbi:hypothetical protein BU16DRAFT_360299 [Lophium mytilinum]|uniref:Uncharacterized protein n=1 Tax=Lophium mytilinum TaxID=390894 RepID=A0A6A6QVH6_9PEZI|nr:hypothetical protein BU16DRAFT_360299 [Lophium mytilinum]
MLTPSPHLHILYERHDCISLPLPPRRLRRRRFPQRRRPSRPRASGWRRRDSVSALDPDVFTPYSQFLATPHLLKPATPLLQLSTATSTRATVQATTTSGAMPLRAATRTGPTVRRSECTVSTSSSAVKWSSMKSQTVAL